MTDGMQKNWRKRCVAVTNEGIATNPLRICWICGKTISLEQCKIDESGLPVHGECYVAKIMAPNPEAPFARDGVLVEQIMTRASISGKPGAQSDPKSTRAQRHRSAGPL